MLVTPAFAETSPTDGTQTETGAAHGGESAVFPPFNPETFASQLLWLAITFGLFFLFMQKVIVPRIGGIIETRRDRIARDLEEAGRLKSEADQAVAAYEQELAEARNRAHAIAQAAQDKAKAEADAERARIEASLGEKLASAERQIADVKTKALGEVDAIASQTTALIVEQLIGATASDAEVAEAVRAAGGK